MAYEHPTRVGASRPNRRDLLTTTMLLGTGLLSGCTTVAAGGASAGALRGEALIDDVAHRTFRFFWETTNPANGLAPDRYPSKSFARSEDRRVGKECVSRCRVRWSPYH